MSGRILAAVLLTLLYALVLGSADPWDLALGAALSAGLIITLGGFLFPEPERPRTGLLRRCAAFVPFVGVVLLNTARGTWDVALVILHLRPMRRPGIVAVPIGERTRLGVAVGALAETISPGSFLVDVDWERRLMFFHVLDAGDPEAFRRTQHDFYQRWQRHVFP
jgi:multisubunit Na+/H+ antiporter MnhE subunit